MKETPKGLITTKQMWAILAFIVVAFGVTNIGGESCELGYLYGNGIYITNLKSNPEVLNLLAPYLRTNQTDAWDKNQTDDFDGTYLALTGRPTDLKNFTNNAGYITLANISQLPAALETDPQVGAVTAGKYCGGNGTAINCNLTAPTTPTAPSSTPLNRSGYVTIFEEFNGDTLNTFPITLGTQSITSSTNVFGVYKWTTGTTIGNDAGIGLGYTTTTTGALYNVTYSTLETRMLLSNTAGYRMFIGFLKTSVSADVSTINAATVFFTNTTYGGAYWYAMCCNAAGASNCYKMNTTIPRDYVNYHRFKIDTKDTYAAFYIDNILRGNCSLANKYPRNVGYAYAGVYQETTDTAADNHNLDFIDFQTKRR
jgi:hypothetical protein